MPRSLKASSSLASVANRRISKSTPKQKSAIRNKWRKLLEGKNKALRKSEVLRQEDYAVQINTRD